MILLYQRTSQLSPDEAAAARALEEDGARVGYRNAQAVYRKEDAEKADLVITGSEKVRAIYEALGVKVRDVSSTERVISSFAVDAKGSVTAKNVEIVSAYRIQSRSPGWYDVMGPNGPVNDKALRKSEAEALLSDL